MTDERQTSLSTGSTPSDAAAAAGSSEAPASESSTATPSWLDRLLGRRPEKAPGDEAEANGEPGASPKLEITEEELQRRVQAETDRREEKRRQEAAREQRRRLRDEDPWEYTRLEREAEQVAAAETGFVSQLQQIGSIHDRATLDPLLEMIPEADRERILKMEKAGVGLEGRTLIVKEALKALEKQWKNNGSTEAERKLRTNAAFRKQVLAEMRGQRTSEPDLLPASSGEGGDRSLSRLLRDYYSG